MPKMVILVTFGGCRARWLQGDLRKPFLSAFLTLFLDAIYPFLGALIPPNRSQGLRRLLSASGLFFGQSRPIRRVGRGGRARCNVPWSLNKASNALMQSLLLSLNALWVLWLGRVADPKCIWVSILQIYQAFLCSWNFRISLQIPCNTAVFFAKIGP